VYRIIDRGLGEPAASGTTGGKLDRIYKALLAALLMGIAPLWAQDQPASPASSPIVTDRPSVTDASTVIPTGSIQFENGFQDAGTQGTRTIDGPETLIRIGLQAKTELRLYVPDYYDNQAPGNPVSPVSGFGDFAIGVKQQIGPLPGKFDVSVVAYLGMPTGAQAISSHGYDPAVQVPWSRVLSSKWTLAGMMSLYDPTQNGRRNLTFEPAILIDRQLTSPWSAFAEYAGDFSQHAGPRDLAHFGTALTIAKYQQIDFHVGVGSMAGSAYHFFGFGYSFRFQAFRRERH
jgi:hypothetical protein